MSQSTVDLPDPLENPPPATGVHADDLLSQLAGDEIDRLLAESATNEPAAVETPSVVPVTTMTPVAPEPTTVGDLDAVLETAAAERAALQDTDDSLSSVAVLPFVRPEPTPVPMLLKPLVWINAPFESRSDRLREMMGKVAVVTLINAFAVIAYVLVFRRPH